MITLVFNHIRKGLLYSISIGILNSKGNYILILQPTFLLYNENVLVELYYKIIKHDLDILEFNLLTQFDNKKKISSNLYKCSHFKTAINISSIKINKLYKDIDQENEIIFNKLIKGSFFKNIIKKNNLDKYPEIIYNYFHNIFLFCLFSNNTNIYHFDIIGIIQYTNQTKDLKIFKFFNNKQQKINDSIFYINFLYNKTENTFEGKKIALNELFNKLSIIA